MGEEILAAELAVVRQNQEDIKKSLNRYIEQNRADMDDIDERLRDAERRIACMEYVSRVICFGGGVIATLLIQRVFA